MGMPVRRGTCQCPRDVPPPGFYPKAGGISDAARTAGLGQALGFIYRVTDRRCEAGRGRKGGRVMGDKDKKTDWSARMFRIPPELLERLDAYCKKRAFSKTFVIEKAL